MLKKISLVAVLALSAAVMTERPASASGNCGGFGQPSCPTDIPTPPAVLAALGMGFAGLRKRNQEQSENEK